MKITKAEGYKKPNYAVAVAAAMAMVTITGCGGPNLEGAATLANPEEEIQYAGDISVEQMNNVIDYDGGLEMYTEPEDEVQLEGEAMPPIDESDGEEDGKELDDSKETESKEFCESVDDELVLAGDVTVCDPNDDLVLEGGAPIYEEP